MNVDALSACMTVCMCGYVNVSDTLDLKIQTALTVQAGSGNPTQVLWKSDQYS